MALEHAIAVGEFTPGGRGWRDRQRAVTGATLGRPHFNLPTQTWRSAILTERIEHWVSLAQHRSPALGALRARHANRLLHAVRIPADLAERLSPLLWLLGEIQDRDGVAGRAAACSDWCTSWVSGGPRQVRFTPAGEAAMVAYLRSRAAGPRSGLFA